jgi:hypothetical protein
VVKTVTTGITPSGAVAINGAVIYPLMGSVEIVYGIETKVSTTREFRLMSYIDALATTHTITTQGPATDTSGDGLAVLTGGLTRVTPNRLGTLTSAIDAGTAYTTLAVTSTAQNISINDIIVVGVGPNAATFIASAAAAAGSTTIDVNSVTPTVTWAIGTQVFDSSLADGPGQPCVALSYTFVQDAGALINNWLYPDPGNTGSYSLYTFAPSYNGILLTHQTRVVTLGLSNNPWVGSGTYFQTNETLNYTDPPGGEAMGEQNEVFVAEFPSGIGAYGTISAGELFLVKNYGGGVIISGDLNNPTVTYLGGVTPTGAQLCTGAQTPVGFVYAADGNGVWVWQGGQSSTKLSNNLNDDFYEIGLTNTAIKFCACPLGDWVVMTGGWVLDTTNGGWWLLENPGFAPLYYGPAADGSGVWAVAGTFSASTTPVIAQYSFGTPQTSYTWKSYPIKVTDKGRTNFNLTVREVAIRAQGDGTVTVTFEGVGGSTAVTLPTTATVDGNQPAITRATVGTGTGTFTAQDMTVSMTVAGVSSGPAPVVYSLSIGVEETTPANQT